MEFPKDNQKTFSNTSKRTFSQIIYQNILSKLLSEQNFITFNYHLYNENNFNKVLSRILEANYFNRRGSVEIDLY